ncbi:MAG: MtrB/PioB family decaheme-associated outer membrane protein [candidate division NC10 bacterium]|nr:MtrB/PioB family decaheme-associated outer membrane protein [candidate division NC10 bacterium]
MRTSERVLRGVLGGLLVGVVLGSVVAVPSLSRAETDLGFATLSGEAEVGGRLIEGDFSSSKFEEYRDLDAGPFGNLQFLIEGKEGKYFFTGSGTDIGEGDQHYEVRIGRYGRYRLELEYDEMPHEFSHTARTLYPRTGSALDFPDATQAAVQGAATAAARAAILQNALAGASRVPLEFEQKSGRAELFYRPLADLEVNAGFRIQDKDGTRPFGMGFGSPGGNFANVAAPINEQTREVTAGVEVAQDTWNIRLDYLGSFYDDALDSVTVDNPLRATDAALVGTTSAPGRGRTSTAPDNSAHTFRLSGATTLPIGFPTRFAGTFSYGLRFQDENFIPHTINTAFVSPLLALPQTSLDGEVHTMLLNLLVTGRPHPDVNVTTRYRMYDYTDETDAVAFPAHVLNDQSFVAETRFTTPSDHTIHNAGVDVSYRVAKPVTVKGGYEWERWDRSDHREVQLTDEHIAKAAVDYRPANWALLRAGYNVGFKRGSNYETFAHLAHAVQEEELAAAELTSQSILLRKYDEANRVRQLVSLLAQLTPVEEVTLAFTGGYGLTDYDDTTLGLTDEERWNAGFDVSYSPLDWLTLSTWYTFEWIEFRQRSRFRPVVGGVAVDNPVNDWSSSSEDTIHTAGVGADIVLLKDLLDLSLSYTVQAARAQTRANGAAGATAVPDGGNAVDWGDIEDTLHTFLAALRYHILNNLTVKFEYRFEAFTQDNFKTDHLDPFMPNSNVNGSGVVTPSNDVFLGDRQEDFHAHILALSLIYRF